MVQDNNWFMDTELLILAETLGYRIFDLPVRWVDDLDSRVKICRTAWEDLRGLLRLRKALGRSRWAPAGETWLAASLSAAGSGSKSQLELRNRG